MLPFGGTEGSVRPPAPRAPVPGALPRLPCAFKRDLGPMPWRLRGRPQCPIDGLKRHVPPMQYALLLSSIQPRRPVSRARRILNPLAPTGKKPVWQNPVNPGPGLGFAPLPLALPRARQSPTVTPCAGSIAYPLMGKGNRQATEQAGCGETGPLQDGNTMGGGGPGSGAALQLSIYADKHCNGTESRRDENGSAREKATPKTIVQARGACSPQNGGGNEAGGASGGRGGGYQSPRQGAKVTDDAITP
jgi:hypothetical protein